MCSRKLLGAVLVCLSCVQAFAWDTNDWEFLDLIERTHFKMFRETKVGPYQLTCDMIVYDNPYNFGPITSIAGIGFKLSSMCVGHYRGWVSYEEAYGEVLRLLKVFGNELSSDPDVFPRVNGWTYHFYNNGDGTMNDKDGLSLLDHMLFIGGVITVAEYFKGTEAAEIAQRLYSETQWDNTWSGDNDYTGWGYAENLLAIIEAADAPQHSKHATASNMWASVTAGIPYHLPLYYWQYPHCYVDFRARWDPRGLNHENIARDTILHQRTWCTDRFNEDPARYNTYTNSTFGLSACGSSTGYRILNAIDEWSSDSGSITPICIPPCMIYAGTETMATMKHLYNEYYIKGWSAPRIPVWSDVYGLANCYNIGQPSDSGRSEYYNAFNADIDYGPNVLMLENYRLGTVWRYFMQNPCISNAMGTVGFGPVQTVRVADFTNAVNPFGGSIGSWANGGATSGASFVLGGYVNPAVVGHFVRIAANGPASGGWIELGGRDQRGQAQVSFWARGHTGQERIRVGLKDLFEREHKVDLGAYLGGATPTNWTEVKIPIEDFCITGVVSNDIWPGNLVLLSFEFTNSEGGDIDIDSLGFTADTLAPSMPTSSLRIAHFRGVPRIAWGPMPQERDLVGYRAWRRATTNGAFAAAPVDLAPAHQGYVDDSSFAGFPGQYLEYAIQALDNAPAPNGSLFGPAAAFVFRGGGRTDVDWGDGRNPNVLGGSADGYWGPATSQTFDFVQAALPDGSTGWVRRSSVSSGNAGHFIDLADGDAGDHAALAFWVRGFAGGEELRVGLKESGGDETKMDLSLYLDGFAIATNWLRAVIPFTDFTNVDMTSLELLSLEHAASGTVYIAGLSFLLGQRPELMNKWLFEAEGHVSQSGARVRDYKPAASGREVLGEGWGADTNSVAEYDVFVDRPLSNQYLNVRYACWAGDGRDVRVTWNGVSAGAFGCINSGGWGEDAWHYAWTRCALPALTSGWHRMKLTVDAADASVNLDGFTIEEDHPWFRECEEYTSQVGSGGEDLKPGASAGEVLGMSWGTNVNSEAVYNSVGTSSLTGAWFHLWYALYGSVGQTIDVFVDGARRARLICAPTAGWGSRACDFGQASACIGALGPGPHAVSLETDGGQAINLDCFSVSESGPATPPGDSDADGLGDRQESVAGTLPGTTDSDGDGISDGDEVQFGLAGQVSDPAKKDTDGDGADDREEWVAGTDPGDAGSIFQWLEISGENPPIIGKIVRWPSSTGRTYSIYACTNSLIAAGWLELTSSVSATPPENAWTDTIERTPPVIYRIDARRSP